MSTFKRSGAAWVGLLAASMMTGMASAETCITQSAMPAAERDALVNTAYSLATKIQANDLAGVKAGTIPEFASNFTGMASAIGTTAPKLAGDAAEVQQVYILDATDNKPNADGGAAEADFVCNLNKGTAEADFTINGLPPGRYAFAMVEFRNAAPWLLSMLLRQDAPGGAWKLAGLYPKERTAAGHDGLWYWSQGRQMAANKQPWVAYVYYEEAQQLLKPAVFVSSTHLENLRTEAVRQAPSEIPDGISMDTPLVLKGSDGTEFRFVALVPDNSLHQDKLDIAAHLALDPSVTDQDAITKKNHEAMVALLTQHPELRQNFHGMWVFAEAPGRAPIASEAPMDQIH